MIMLCDGRSRLTGVFPPTTQVFLSSLCDSKALTGDQDGRMGCTLLQNVGIAYL